jgi:serine/threonine protein kinase
VYSATICQRLTKIRMGMFTFSVTNSDDKRLTIVKLCEVIEGVTYLHSCDPVVIHGDLKPASQLIS